MQYYTVLALAALASANPFAFEKRQAVTAKISPTGSAPPGCSASVSYSFGIAVKNITTSTSTASGAARMARRQATDTSTPVHTMAPVSMIADGQIQGGMHTMVMMPIVNQIGDGQIQAMTTMAAVTEYKDGQPQAPSVPIATPTSTTQAAGADAQNADAEPAATSAAGAAAPTTLATSTGTSSSPAASSSTPPSVHNVACKNPDSLEITLADGITTDAKGRTGYIASNYQFQFDSPPQAGAIYTAGFSVCGNGSLALGGSNVFYQCLSGSFYNLYDRHWAAQCSPITINVLELIDCPA